MKQHEYPALEGLEVLTSQAIAAIEAAEESGKPNPHCTQCVKSRQKYNGDDGDVIITGPTIEIPVE